MWIKKSNKGVFSDDDIFIYKINHMNLEDVIYINCLILDRIHNIVGFSEAAGIRKSLVTYSCISGGLNHFDGMIAHLEKMGYEMNKASKYQILADSFSLGKVTFSESERHYIDAFSKVKALYNAKKENLS